MRQYQRIWELLKADKFVQISVNKEFVARVKKAVIKEKDSDTAFKILHEKLYVLFFQYDQKTSVLSIELRKKLEAGDL